MTRNLVACKGHVGDGGLGSALTACLCALQPSEDHYGLLAWDCFRHDPNEPAACGGTLLVNMMTLEDFYKAEERHWESAAPASRNCCLGIPAGCECEQTGLGPVLHLRSIASAPSEAVVAMPLSRDELACWRSLREELLAQGKLKDPRAETLALLKLRALKTGLKPEGPLDLTSVKSADVLSRPPLNEWAVPPSDKVPVEWDRKSFNTRAYCLTDISTEARRRVEKERNLTRKVYGIAALSLGSGWS